MINRLHIPLSTTFLTASVLLAPFLVYAQVPTTTGISTSSVSAGNALPTGMTLYTLIGLGVIILVGLSWFLLSRKSTPTPTEVLAAPEEQKVP